MQKNLIIFICGASLFFSCLVFAENDLISEKGGAVVLDQNSHLLPNQFSVFTDGKIVINHFSPGFDEKILAVDNTYQDNPGCYITCYSHSPRGAAYLVGGNIYAMGLIRVPGKYNEKNICVPAGNEDKDISANILFKKRCDLKFRNCQFTPGGCWAGGDTGQWL